MLVSTGRRGRMRLGALLPMAFLIFRVLLGDCVARAEKLIETIPDRTSPRG
jgi:hypothetical protein